MLRPHDSISMSLSPPQLLPYESVMCIRDFLMDYPVILCQYIPDRSLHTNNVGTIPKQCSRETHTYRKLNQTHSTPPIVPFLTRKTTQKDRLKREPCSSVSPFCLRLGKRNGPFGGSRLDGFIVDSDFVWFWLSACCWYISLDRFRTDTHNQVPTHHFLYTPNNMYDTI